MYFIGLFQVVENDIRASCANGVAQNCHGEGNLARLDSRVDPRAVECNSELNRVSISVISKPIPSYLNSLFCKFIVIRQGKNSKRITLSDVGGNSAQDNLQEVCLRVISAPIE